MRTQTKRFYSDCQRKTLAGWLSCGPCSDSWAPNCTWRGKSTCWACASTGRKWRKGGIMWTPQSILMKSEICGCSSWMASLPFLPKRPLRDQKCDTSWCISHVIPEGSSGEGSRALAPFPPAGLLALLPCSKACIPDAVEERGKWG